MYYIIHVLLYDTWPCHILHNLVLLYHVYYTSSTTLYTDISTVMFSNIVLNDDQWRVGFVLDTNDLTSTINYQQRVLKRLTEVRRKWIDQQHDQDTSLKKSIPLIPSYKDDLIVAQQTIESLQERLIELESQQGK